MNLFSRGMKQVFYFVVYLVVNGLDMMTIIKIEISLGTEVGLNFLIYENVFSSLILKGSNSTPLKWKYN